MKKEYVTPQSDIYQIESVQLLSGSNGSIPGGEPGNGIQPQSLLFDEEDE